MIRMTKLLDYLANTELVSLSALRMSLRACLHKATNLQTILIDGHMIFSTLSGGIFWPAAIVSEIWKSLYIRSEGLNETCNDLPTLLRLCAQGNMKAQAICHKTAINLWHKKPKVMRDIISFSLAVLEYDDFSTKGQPSNLAFVIDLYALNPTETKLLEVAALSFECKDFKSFLDQFPVQGYQHTWEILSVMTGISVKEIQEVWIGGSKLKRSGLVVLDMQPFDLEGLIQLGHIGKQLFLLHANTKEELRDKFLPLLPEPSLCANDFIDVRQKLEWTVGCLRNTYKSRNGGVHILIHGPSGTGKTELSRIILKDAGIKGFNVSRQDCGGVPDLNLYKSLERCYWAQEMLHTSSSVAFVIEMTNAVGDTSQTVLVEALDRIIIPTIWICEDTEHLSPPVLNRFLYHLELKAPSTNARMKIVEKYVEPVCADAKLVQNVASNTFSSPAQICKAAKFAKLAGLDANPSPEMAILSALQAGHQAMGNSPVPSFKDDDNAEWDINALCLEASAPMSKILAALNRTPVASLAFHGIPGTGKTSLAKYIAQSLNRPLIAKRVSQLSSKWVGETEKFLADMFSEASNENAVLLLDEGDSFLRDRKFSTNSWEVTQTNEMLQQMDAYKGIFICATNLMEDIDVAALRRFTFKVKFLPLNPEQRLKMFARFALKDPAALICRDIEQKLEQMDQLAPGDFATVRRQEAILNERFDVKTWISQLEREQALRKPTDKQRMGFV